MERIDRGQWTDRGTRSQRPKLAWLCALALASAPLCAAATEASLLKPLPARAPQTATTRVDSDWILARLARPAPMRTAFVELRGSALLKAPLRIAGEYQRPSADTLVREVRSPYAETTTIRAGEVRIARGDKAPRTFSLSRAPELVGLQASFGALLAGDRALLEQHYRVASQGTRAAWTLTLTPRHAALAAKVQAIALYGRGAELRCIETRPARGDIQRTLLAGAARAAQDISAAGELVTLCRGAGAPAR
ncbi:LolA-related protein [Lysobacter koreensis]|uniref:LolA-related protein n=1 Tax=Lysobacter koreensis TaxID=266122 RepID=A0ABW2YQF2_9GAMM